MTAEEAEKLVKAKHPQAAVLAEHAKRGKLPFIIVDMATFPHRLLAYGKYKTREAAWIKAAKAVAAEPKKP